MVRKLFGVLAVALVLCLGAVLADEITGLITKVDTKAKEIHIQDKDGKEVVITYNADTKFTKAGRGKKGEEPPPPTAITVDDVKTGLEKAMERGGKGVGAKVTTKGTSKVATEIQLRGGGRGKGGGQ